MTATSTVSPHRLDSLPDEVLNLILSHVSTQHDLGALCLVNHRLNHVADPLLHRSISFKGPKHHLSFSESLASRPRRGSLIQHVRLDYPGSELSELELFLRDSDSRRGIDSFSHTISTMSNLENLVVSVPESLGRGIGTLFNGPFDLACLRTCSLYYQTEDGGYWDLQDNLHIFSHPTLEELTIRRAKLALGFETLEKPSETALRDLHLIECDINDDALADLLQIPEGLKKFTMSQARKPSPPLEESSEDIEDYILTLASQSHSLQYVSIDYATLGAESALRLREFQELTFLQLRDFQLWGQSVGKPRLHSVGIPPNLEILEFLDPVTDDEEIIDLMCYTFQSKDITARKLKKLIVPGGGDGLPKEVREACKASGLHVEDS
ncbi:F-box domain-containing protein [Xylogone sp. PMI_703]|nr:F-box domain-containing protein [Xylogone sp. PMI_703]